MRDNDWYLRDEEDEFGEALHRRTEELYSVPDSIPDQDGLIECPVLPMRDPILYRIVKASHLPIAPVSTA